MYKKEINGKLLSLSFRNNKLLLTCSFPSFVLFSPNDLVVSQIHQFNCLYIDHEHPWTHVKARTLLFPGALHTFEPTMVPIPASAQPVHNPNTLRLARFLPWQLEENHSLKQGAKHMTSPWIFYFDITRKIERIEK